MKRLACICGLALLAACNPPGGGGSNAQRETAEAGKGADGPAAAAQPSKAALVESLRRTLGEVSRNAEITTDDPFRVWPRALAAETPFPWGVLANDMQMIDSPVGGGLAQRMELRTSGTFTVRMVPPPNKRLFFLCSVEPSNLSSSPSTPGLVRWEAHFGQAPADGEFSRDPVSNYWTFATSITTTGASGYVRITSPMGPEPHWAIGFCDVLPFELPPP
jgi:hypothetical protein